MAKLPILISVIIPVYNVQDYLNQCINSVLNQSSSNFEIILIDDGSTDNSGVICDEYSQKDKRVSVIHKKNKGVSEARNDGLNLARGEFVLFFDSDDYFDSLDALENLESKIKNKNIDVVFYKINLLYEADNKKVIPQIKFVKNEFDGLRNDELFFKLIKSSEFKPSVYSKIVKRKILIDNKIYFTKSKTSSEDIEWFLKLFEHIVEADCISTFIYNHRMQRPVAITNTIKLKNLEDLLDTIINEKDRVDNDYINYSELYRKCHYSYLAYQYTILLGLYRNLKDVDKIRIKPSLESLKSILRFQLYKRTSLVYKLYEVFGFKITTTILGSYIKFRNKGKVNL